MDYLTKITTVRPRPSRVTAKRDLVEETESNRGRIIQSAAIRRLQQKTQVYPLETNAAVRSRLTHSLEVQQTGRYLAKTILELLAQAGQLKKLGLEGIETAFTNLVEMSCLMHDVGNPPFGHFGESSISRWMVNNAERCHLKSIQKNDPTSLFTSTLLPDLCEFEGNAQGLRVIDTIQELNLTWSQLGALIKYTRPPYQPRPEANKPFYYCQKKPGFYYSEQELVKQLWRELDISQGCRFPLVYIMEAADDISYCIADLEDAVDKGILSLQGLKYLLNKEWETINGVNTGYLPDIISSANNATGSNPYEFIIRLRTRLVKDLVQYAAKRYLHHHQVIFDGTLDEPLIDGDSDQHRALETLKNVAINHVFTSQEKETPELRGYAGLMGLMDIYQPLLELSRKDFNNIVVNNSNRCFIEQRLFHRLSPKCVAAYTRAMVRINSSDNSAEEQEDLEWYYRTRLIIDYISGMTDHFVITEYQSLSAI